MNPMPRILLVGDPLPPAIGGCFETAGFPVLAQRLAGGNPEVLRQVQLIVLMPTDAQLPQAQALCRRWRIELGEQYVPILWLQESNQLRPPGLDAGADVCLPLAAPEEYLLAQTRALLRTQHVHERLLARSNEVGQINQRLQQAYQQIDGDLELTRRIHRGFLPTQFPEVNQTRFAVCYRPRSRIGGDFYDAVRLDEHHVGFFVADAMARGLPASSLLSIFAKRSISMKEISKNGYRLVPPGEVLNKLNHDLLALSLPEQPIVTMVYGLLNAQNGELTFARAAHPHPLHVPVLGEPEYWHANGSLLGVFEANYEEQKRTLQPGDKLVLVTDGVYPPQGDKTSRSPDQLRESAGKHRQLPLQSFVDQVARDLLETSRHPEDFTLLAIEYK